MLSLHLLQREQLVRTRRLALRAFRFIPGDLCLALGTAPAIFLVLCPVPDTHCAQLTQVLQYFGVVRHPIVIEVGYTAACEFRTFRTAAGLGFGHCAVSYRTFPTEGSQSSSAETTVTEQIFLWQLRQT